MADDAEVIVLAHVRQIVIGELLHALSRDQADAALSAAIKHLTEYADQGPARTIRALISQDRFQVIVDAVIDDLRARKIEASAN